MIAEVLFGECEPEPDNARDLEQRSEYINELNTEFSEEYKQSALDWTNNFINDLKQQKDNHMSQLIGKHLKSAIQVDAVSQD